jgi:type II secretory pathway component GspD/PulD (secretin)
VAEFNGIYYIGNTDGSDVVTAVVRMVPAERRAFLDALQKGISDHGKVAVVGGSLYISDNLENVRKLLDDIEKLRDYAEHSYIAEVFFIRVKEDDFVKVTGDLQIRSIDVFASTTNLDELFQMFLDASAGKGFASVEQRPVLYLSEGRKATFEVGSEIVREKKTVMENGAMHTSGYEKFQDGLKLSLTLGRVSPEHYAVDFDLDVSTFDQSKKTSDTIPASDKSVLTLPGLLVKDSQIYYVGSLKRKDSRRVFSLFGVDTGKSNDHLTVWFRVRELQK